LNCLHYVVVTIYVFFEIGFGETVDIAHEMAARDSLRQLFGTLDTISLPFNLELNDLCSSDKNNLSLNEWSQQSLTTQPLYFKPNQTKNISCN